MVQHGYPMTSHPCSCMSLAHCSGNQGGLNAAQSMGEEEGMRVLGPQQWYPGGLGTHLRIFLLLFLGREEGRERKGSGEERAGTVGLEGRNLDRRRHRCSAADDLRNRRQERPGDEVIHRGRRRRIHWSLVVVELGSGEIHHSRTQACLLEVVSGDVALPCRLCGRCQLTVGP